MKNEKEFWFKRRRIGWGWSPSSREGWFITLIFLIFIIVLSFRTENISDPKEIFWQFLLPLGISILALIIIAYKTGEKPRWSWNWKNKKNHE